MENKKVNEENINDREKFVSKDIDYKNINFLKRFLSETGKINPRRNGSLSGKEQRKINKAIKIARYLALLPYCDNHK